MLYSEKDYNVGCYRLSGISPFRGLDDAETYANITHVRYDAHALYHNCTKYSLKFIYQVLKRRPK